MPRLRFLGGFGHRSDPRAADGQRTPTSALSRNVIGAGWMLLAAAAFTVMTTLVKFLGAHYSSALETFYRQAAGLLILSPAIVRHGRRAFVTDGMAGQIFRALATLGGFILTFESFRLLPLATANALSFTRVLWVLPIAVLFLKERVGPLRLTAMLAGFGGVLMMLRPQGGGALWPYAAALLGALLLACANMTAKSLAGRLPMVVMLAWAALLGTVLSLPFALFTWRWPSLVDVVLLGLMGGAGVLSQYAYISGLRIGDTAAVVPVDYSRLLMAVGVGVLVFGEIPDRTTMLGAAVVVGSTLLILWREQQLARAATPIAKRARSRSTEGDGHGLHAAAVVRSRGHSDP